MQQLSVHCACLACVIGVPRRVPGTLLWDREEAENLTPESGEPPLIGTDSLSEKRQFTESSSSLSIAKGTIGEFRANDYENVVLDK
jgi:hypothetical protein